ncbi:acyltransferase family protein [Lysobacter brunescens]|uniref:Acyltransferase family protein n=1 Tax=Lysobacter brunescens TaxID=262323 RepID=A0ABW2Y7H0_9GAMM
MSELAGPVPTEVSDRVVAAPAVRAGDRGRLEELDALRGLAALGVVVYHYTTFYQSQHGHLHPLGFGFPAGNYGVHLFFLISGFVIFMTLDRTRTAADFVVSRFSRLFPAYWAALLLTTLVVHAIGMPQQRPDAATFVANTTMLQEILGFEDIDGSYWTLQVELFFYAQMLLWFVLRQLHRIPWIIAGWLLLVLAYALALRQGWHFSYTTRVLLNLLYIPYFALGILFYRLHAARGSRRANIALILASLATIGIAYEPVYFVVGLSCTAVFALFLGGGLRWLRHRLFLFLGGISYALYLLHQAIGFAVIHRLERLGVPSLAAITLALALALGLATLLNRWIERPAMRAIRQRWQSRRRAPAA